MILYPQHGIVNPTFQELHRSPVEPQAAEAGGGEATSSPSRTVSGRPRCGPSGDSKLNVKELLMYAAQIASGMVRRGKGRGRRSK